MNRQPTVEQLAWLRANDVAFVQGFIVGRPGTSAAIIGLLEQSLDGREARHAPTAQQSS